LGKIIEAKAASIGQFIRQPQKGDPARPAHTGDPVHRHVFKGGADRI
jgi:hypothetical protein